MSERGVRRSGCPFPEDPKLLNLRDIECFSCFRKRVFLSEILTYRRNERMGMRFSLCFQVRGDRRRRAGSGTNPENKGARNEKLQDVRAQDAAGLLSWCPRALARHRPLLGHGGGWARTVSESNNVLFFAVLLCVCSTFASCFLFGFWSDSGTSGCSWMVN